MLNCTLKQAFSRSGGTLARNQHKINFMYQRHMIKRDQSLRNQAEFFHFLEKDEFKPELQRVQLYGQEQMVIGSSQDMRSPDYVLAMISQFDPKAVVLGGLNKQQLKEYQIGYDFYNKEPKIQNNELDLPAKEALTHFFQEDLQFGQQWFQQENDQCVYRVVKNRRHAIMEDSLSCGIALYEKANRHLLFGKADQFLVFEDLALRLPLQQLKDVFFHCVQSIYQDIESKSNDSYPYFENERIYDLLHCKARELYQDLLFDKSILFQASLFKKAARSFSKAAIIVPNEIAKKLAIQTLEPMAPEWDQIFRAYIKEDEDKEFFAAEKFSSKKYSRSFRNIKRYFKDDPDYARLVKAAEKQSSKYDYFSKERPLFEMIKNQEIDSQEILEKYVILDQLIEKRTQLYLQNSVNPFSNSVFHGIFKEHYGSSTPESVQKIHTDYEELNQKYSAYLHKLQNSQIERIGDFPLNWRPTLEQFSQTVKRIEDKPNNYNYELVIGKINRQKRNRIVESMLLKTLVELLRQREKAGISQSDQIVHVKQYFEGTKTAENIKIVSQLLLDANQTLGSIVKFPKIYKQFLPYLVNLRKYQTIKSIEQRLDEVEKQALSDEKLNIFKGLSASSLDYISKKRGETFDEEEKIEGIKELFDGVDEQILVLGDNPEKIPFDVKGKSQEELIEMGFQSVGEMEFQVDENGKVQGVESEESKQLMEFLDTLKKNDKDYQEVNSLNKSDEDDDDED